MSSKTNYNYNKVASCLSLFVATVMARSTGMYRNRNNSEGDTSVKGYAIVPYIHLRCHRTTQENIIFSQSQKILLKEIRKLMLYYSRPWHISISNHALNRDDGVYICQRNTCISLAGDVIPWVFKKLRLHL